MKRHLIAAAVGSAFASGVGAMPSGWQTRTDIFGSLKANGHIFLSDTNGRKAR